MISDFLKQYYNADRKPSLYFWRDLQGNEIDCILEQSLSTALIEIKAGKTVTLDYFKQFSYWKKITDLPTKNYLVYAGSTLQHWTDAEVRGWQTVGKLVSSQDSVLITQEREGG